MRVIVTGGTGLIGRHLVRGLVQDGNEVIVLSRNPASKAPLMPSGARLIQWDAETPNGWGHLLEEDETFVINLAGHATANWRWTKAHKARVLQSRVRATQAVVQAIQQADAKPHALIQASAVGYYGNTGEIAVTEDAPPNSCWRARVCRAWEAATNKAGVRTVILRIGLVLAQNGGVLPAYLWAADLSGLRLGHGQQWMPWIHNDDVTHIIRFAMHHPDAHGSYNATAPTPIRNQDFMEMVALVRGRPTWFPVPAFALYAAMGEQANVVLDSQRILPQRLLDAGYKFRYAEPEAALRDILSHPLHWKD